MYRKSCLILLLLFTAGLTYAGSKDTFAYHTIEHLKNNLANDTSAVSDYQDFFDKRMNGDSKKYGPYKILFETDQYVYYGRSFLNRHGLRVVDRYYRTDKQVLQEKFPLYKKEVWFELWEKGDCMHSTTKYYDSLKKAGYINVPELIWTGGTSYRLTDYIEADNIYHKKHWFRKNILSIIICTTYFDKHTLAVVRTSQSEQEYTRPSKRK